MIGEDYSVEQLVKEFEARRIAPDAHFVAAAGPHYGEVAAWRLLHAGWCIVSWCRDGVKDYGVSEGLEELGGWLEDKLLQGVESLVSLGNIYGILYLSFGTNWGGTDHVVLISAETCGGYYSTSCAQDDKGQDLHFSESEDACQWVQDRIQTDRRNRRGDSFALTYMVVRTQL